MASPQDQAASDEITFVVPPGGIEVNDDANTRKTAPSSTLEIQNFNTRTTQDQILGDDPLDGMTPEDIKADVAELVDEHGLQEYRSAFEKGALLASTQQKGKMSFEEIEELSEQEKEQLRFEAKHYFKVLPGKQWAQVVLCASCAMVQGMDQTVINGAQEFYFAEFGVTEGAKKGLINSAPYIAAATLGCWLTTILNSWFGRRGTIFLCCAVAAGTAVWQAVATSWIQLLAARIVLGLAVGPKSATTPMYTAECAPANVRGRFTSGWQTFTAFGIMIGYAISLAFQNTDFMGENTQWRWMLGVTALPPMIVCAAVFFIPESPRWYLEKDKLAQGFLTMRKFRKHDYQAARDIYSAWKHIERENRLKKKNGFQSIRELCRPRNLRAAQSAYFCMFMQQFCGVNVIAYYSTTIFMQAGFSRQVALGVSLGCGCCNFLGALPALFTIDKCGRRRLLIVTFPLLACCLAWAAGSFSIANQLARFASTAAAIFLFMIAYSPGAGPVPFTYSAEAFSLSARSLGMSSATAITWLFNFVINFTWPMMVDTWTPAGGFGFYAAWNILGWIYAYFLLPETKGYSLEQLDKIFTRSNKSHAAEKWAKLKKNIRQCFCRSSEVVEVSEVLETKMPIRLPSDDSSNPEMSQLERIEEV